jgi:hypothetical protein
MMTNNLAEVALAGFGAPLLALLLAPGASSSAQLHWWSERATALAGLRVHGLAPLLALGVLIAAAVLALRGAGAGDDLADLPPNGSARARKLSGRLPGLSGLAGLSDDTVIRRPVSPAVRQALLAEPTSAKMRRRNSMPDSERMALEAAERSLSEGGGRQGTRRAATAIGITEDEWEGGVAGSAAAASTPAVEDALIDAMDKRSSGAPASSAPRSNAPSTA